MIDGLYEVKKHESDKLFTMWLDAFHDYPKLAEAFPQEDKKLAAMEAAIRFYGMYDIKYGHIYAIDEKLNEAVAVVDSENMKYTVLKCIAAGCYSKGYRKAMSRLTPDERKKQKAVFAELDKLEETMDIPYPHIYVDFLGVKKDYQGNGRGSMLIRRVSEYAEQRNRPVMLFTNTVDDVKFYRKEGFDIIGIVKSEKYGFENTYMVRSIR